ncbi:MAG: hypothetical protein IJX77_10095 [Ruminococcus sp.]|nr:hypothetical protein [Ruminococcus sp.]
MNGKNRNIIVIAVMAVLLFGMSLWSWMKGADEYSESERRILADFPGITADSVESGAFMQDFESYAMDQFPLRDKFRGLKSFSELSVFRKLDNNGLYPEDGYISKTEYPLNEEMLDYAAERFRYIYDNYLSDKDMNIYFSIVPDKNYYTAPETERLSLDYSAMIEKMREKTEYMAYIDITELLEKEDYYRTDTHWRQEKIIDIAEKLASEMGAVLESEYTVNELDNPFYGVYCGQLALLVEPDTIRYLTSETLEQCRVTSWSTGTEEESVLYNMEKAFGKDPYEMFLSGSEPLLTIENPNADTERELIIFRDSFASSLAPLLADGYSKITLVDIRYVRSSMLGNFIEFGNQDVLFLYSTLLLNNSMAMK